MEFALLLPVILLLIGTMIITGLRGVYSALGVHEARVAAREASIRLGQSPRSPYPTRNDICRSPSRLLAFPGSVFNEPLCTLSIDSKASAPGAGDMVTVRLTYQLTSFSALNNFVPFRGLDTMTQSASVMRE